jgi:hypothetical protein
VFIIIIKSFAMKTIFSVLVIISFSIIGCKKDPPLIKEIPDGLFQANPCPSIYGTLLSIFPYSTDNRITRAPFFSDTVQKRIIVTSETEVYLTFIDDNANVKSSVGWYSYDKNNMPGKSSGVDKQIIIPNASVAGQGGKLQPGSTVQVGTGKFSAGTVIGFYLIHDGWRDGTIAYDYPLIYTDYQWNAGQYQQHVLYMDRSCNSLVLSWEDTPLTMLSDADFNDVVFTVSDNKDNLPIKSFDLTGMILW